MEASTLTPAVSRAGILGRRSPLLKLQGDERLVALIRDGHDHAFEVLFERYHSRLLAFCRHMLRSTEDAEDVLQEVFVKAHAAMLADDRHDQRAAVALPDRPQPLPQPPAPPGPRGPGLDGRDGRRERRHDRRPGPEARGLPRAGRRRPGPARDPAHRAAAARDRRPLLRGDRRDDGHDDPGGQVAAGAGADVARRGDPVAPADLRRGPARARRGRRGPAQGLRARSATTSSAASGCARLPRPAALEHEDARGDGADRPAGADGSRV